MVGARSAAVSADHAAGQQPWLHPQGLPPQVGAVMSTRIGGVSQGPFASLNLRPWADAPGHDTPEAVARNQARFGAVLEGARPVWLDQVHGTRVLRLTPAAGDDQAPRAQADAAITTELGLACTVLVADCLPVLFASACGQVVGAAHAGWRGLAGGVLEATVAAMQQVAGVPASQLHAWLGACIGPAAFEVGADVREAFGPGAEAFFRQKPAEPMTEAAQRAPKWLADLPGLARWRLAQAGLTQVHSCGACTFSEPSRFFSFRRDGVTGRHAAAIWRRG
jgi:YfiH family protein